jgi:hypothetical protein
MKKRNNDRTPRTPRLLTDNQLAAATGGLFGSLFKKLVTTQDGGISASDDWESPVV